MEAYGQLLADFHRAETILSEVAEDTGISVDHIRSPARRRPFTTARQIAMWRMNKAGLPCREIARAVNRDHTTVLHGLRAVSRKLEQAQ